MGLRTEDCFNLLTKQKYSVKLFLLYLHSFHNIYRPFSTPHPTSIRNGHVNLSEVRENNEHVNLSRVYENVVRTLRIGKELHFREQFGRSLSSSGEKIAKQH